MGNLGQVVPADQAVVGLHVAVDQIGGFAEVELLHALAGDAFERARQCRLAKDPARPERPAVVQEKGRGGAVPEVPPFALR